MESKQVPTGTNHRRFWNRREMMRLLFGAFVIAALIWIVTGVGLALREAEFFHRDQFVDPFRERREPSRTFIVAAAINNGAFRAALGIFGLLAAGLITEGYLMLTPSLERDEDREVI